MNDVFLIGMLVVWAPAMAGKAGILAVYLCMWVYPQKIWKTTGQKLI